jgi:hypothetical protein
MKLSLMSTVYQLVENVKQYAYIKAQKEERIVEMSSGSIERLRSRSMNGKR